MEAIVIKLLFVSAYVGFFGVFFLTFHFILKDDDDTTQFDAIGISVMCLFIILLPTFFVLVVLVSFYIKFSHGAVPESVLFAICLFGAEMMYFPIFFYFNGRDAGVKAALTKPKTTNRRRATTTTRPATNNGGTTTKRRKPMRVYEIARITDIPGEQLVQIARAQGYNLQGMDDFVTHEMYQDIKSYLKSYLNAAQNQQPTQGAVVRNEAPSFPIRPTTGRPQDNSVAGVDARVYEVEKASRGFISSRRDQTHQKRMQKGLQHRIETSRMLQQVVRQEAEREKEKNELFKITGEYGKLPPLEQAKMHRQLAEEEAKFWQAKQQSATSQKKIEDLHKEPERPAPVKPPPEPKSISEIAREVRAELLDACRDYRKSILSTNYEDEASWIDAIEARWPADQYPRRAQSIIAEYEQFKQDEKEALKEDKLYEHKRALQKREAFFQTNASRNGLNG